MSEGLYQKYVLSKADGSPIDPGERYFVLHYNGDPAACMALLAYADVIEATNSELASDLRLAVRQYAGVADLGPSPIETLRAEIKRLRKAALALCVSLRHWHYGKMEYDSTEHEALEEALR